MVPLIIHDRIKKTNEKVLYGVAWVIEPNHTRTHVFSMNRELKSVCYNSLSSKVREVSLYKTIFINDHSYNSR